MDTHGNTKKAIRDQMRIFCNATGAPEREMWSLAICEHLADTFKHYGCRKVMLFHPLPDEPDITPLLALPEYTIILPTIDGEDIIPRIYNPNASLSAGAYNILEPDTPEYEGDIDLVVIPGRAFDYDGGRLGRGKGFYDRFLKLYPNAIRVGICFPFQLMNEKILMLPHDEYIDLLITPMKTKLTTFSKLNK